MYINVKYLYILTRVDCNQGDRSRRRTRLRYIALSHTHAPTDTHTHIWKDRYREKY